MGLQDQAGRGQEQRDPERDLDDLLDLASGAERSSDQDATERCRHRSQAEPTDQRLVDGAHPHVHSSAGRFITADTTRSLDTAASGETPKKRTNIGVISAPPPMPVRPSTKPTITPPNARDQSIGRTRSTGLLGIRTGRHRFVTTGLSSRTPDRRTVEA